MALLYIEQATVCKNTWSSTMRLVNNDTLAVMKGDLKDPGAWMVGGDWDPLKSL